MKNDITVEDIRHTAKSYRRGYNAALSEWLDSVANTLAASDRTIAEQAAALEGYRRETHARVRELQSWHLRPTSTESGRRILQHHLDKIAGFLPAAEIAELRRRGVEVCSDNQEDQP